jgi:hypothetical protein
MDIHTTTYSGMCGEIQKHILFGELFFAVNVAGSENSSF